MTIVPLADSNADTAIDTTPADDTKTDGDIKADGDTKTEEQPAASTGDGEGSTDQTTDGDGDATGDNDTSSDDKPTIERPEQSDTVETLPGDAEDNKDHIKGEDETEDKGETGEETPEQPEETPDTGSTEEKGDEGTGSEETPEEKPEETPEEDDADYSCAYDPENHRFNITFNIKEDAEGDQTIELSKVQEVVQKYGEQKFDEWLQTEDGIKWMKKAQRNAMQWGDSSNMTVSFDGAMYTLYVSYDEETDTIHQEVCFYNEPACTTIFNVSLTNGSKHTYVYKNNSLTVASPDVSNDDKTGVEGFDGQELPDYYVKHKLALRYDRNAESGCMEDLIDAAFEEFGNKCNQSQYVKPDGSLTVGYANTSVDTETALVKIGNYYYVQYGDNYCGQFKQKDVEQRDDGKFYLVSPKNDINARAYDKDGKPVYYYGYQTHQTVSLPINDVRSAVQKYMSAHGYETYDDYILNYYRKPDGTKYDSVADLVADNPAALKELSKTGAEMPHSSTCPDTVSIHPSTIYDNFYEHLLSFNVGDKGEMDEFLSHDHMAHGHGHGSWSSDGNEMTIGDYMAGKLNETGAWDKANAYFNTLLASGMTENEATWAAFTMAVNIDGELTGNDYQDTAWSWYASMVLHQADGTLDLTKTDAETGEIIGDDEGEGQTSFYLWKYEKDADGNENPMYCTYVEPTYTTNEAGEQVLEKDGFYCWVKYDPAKDKLTYTVTTTNGKLNIDYALLENVVYYLQEAIAPEGYDIDPEIYVICDEESYKQLEGTEVTNPATGATSKVTESSWLGSILGGKTLSINFMNTATVPDPDPDPTPDPDPVPPTDPDTPVDPASPDNPPVQDETPDGDTPVTPENPQNPAVQDATPDAATLPKTGTTGWMAAALASLGSLLMACGWFFTRKQYSPKH